jgi:hypothetical protein
LQAARNARRVNKMDIGPTAKVNILLVNDQPYT